MATDPEGPAPANNPGPQPQVDPEKVKPISGDPYDVEFFQAMKASNTASESEKRATWEIDPEALIHDRKFKDWGSRANMPPSTAECLKHDVTELLPFPNPEGELSVTQRWDMNHNRLLMIMLERMRAGTLVALISPGHHPASRYHSERIALKMKAMLPEFWDFEAEDVEAIYQEQRAKRNPEFIRNRLALPQCMFDDYLPMVMHIKKGHLDWYKEKPVNAALPVRNGCAHWDQTFLIARLTAVEIDFFLAEYRPPRWTRDGRSCSEWELKAEDEGDDSTVELEGDLGDDGLGVLPSLTEAFLMEPVF